MALTLCLRGHLYPFMVGVPDHPDRPQHCTVSPPVKCPGGRGCGPIGEIMEVLTTALHGVPVLRVIGDVDHLSALALDTAVQDALGARGLRVLIDLRACPYLDSGGLSVLLFTFRQLRRNGWIGVVAPN